MQMWEQLQTATRNAFTGGAAGPSGDAEPTASPPDATKKRKKGK
jgi:hypothetical protein